MMKILVTGGAGYIGSHTVLALLEKGYDVVVVDNLANSSAESLKRVEKLVGKKVKIQIFDMRDREKLEKLFAEHSIDAVIHFAGLKAVGESVAEPLKYYDDNLISTIVLCEVMQKYGVKQLVFSSSATVYGDPSKVPITEDMPIKPTNPYGQTKAMIERVLQDVAATKVGWQICLLRYFNPVGAHKSGQIGEDPNGKPNNLLPYISQVAVGRLPMLYIYGNNYDTPDGTGVRDYIHVVDLAAGHVAALEHMPQAGTHSVYNLATGKGTSVLEAVQAFEKASGKKIPYKNVVRRPGDIATCYANPTKAEHELGWHAQKTFADACADAWRWQSQNPNGYT